MNTTKDFMKRLHLVLPLPPSNKKSLQSLMILQNTVATFWVRVNDALVLKPCLTPEPSLDIYIYIYIVLFGPVKPELGVIPSGQENHSGAEHLNFPGRELIVIDFTEQYFFKEKTKDQLF